MDKWSDHEKKDKFVGSLAMTMTDESFVLYCKLNEGYYNNFFGDRQNWFLEAVSPSASQLRSL
jgi:hypothetical protein